MQYTNTNIFYESEFPQANDNVEKKRENITRSLCCIKICVFFRFYAAQQPFMILITHTRAQARSSCSEYCATTMSNMTSIIFTI